jgi:hypothetical protein
MTREQEAQERNEAAKRRRESAGRIRWVGQLMMIVGGGAIAVVLSLHISEPKVPIWVRGNLFTLSGIIVLIGATSYVGGLVLQRGLAQAADDRAECDARAEAVQEQLADIRRGLADVRLELASLRSEVVPLLLEVLRNQGAMRSRPGAADANANGRNGDDPNVVKLDDMRLLKRIDERLRENRDN